MRILWAMFKSLLCFIAGSALLTQVLTCAALYYFHHSDRQYIVVVGGSMEPTIHLGDGLILRNPHPEEIKPGVVVTYRAENNTLTTHRVLAEKTIKGKVFLQTKGDANKTADPNLVAEDSIIGIPETRVPHGGYFVNWMTSKTGRLLTIGPGLLMILFSEMGYIIRVSKEDDGPKSRRKSRGDRRRDKKNAEGKTEATEEAETTEAETTEA